MNRSTPRSMRRRTSTLVPSALLTVAALLTAALTTSAVAHAQTDEERAQAREHFTAGVSHYEAGDYSLALQEFQEAYRIAPHPMVRVNMANCYEHLGRPLEALHHFERFTAEAQNATPQQRREVQSAVRRLEGQLGEVRLSVAPDGATVVIDNSETRRSPVLEPLRLTAGTHHLTVRLDGYRTQNQEITVVGGSSERVTISLERGEDPPAVAAVPPVGGAVSGSASAGPSESDSGGAAEPVDAEADVSASATATVEPDPEPVDSSGGGWDLQITTPVIISAAATGGLLIGAVATGIVAVTANDDFEAAVVRVNAASNEAERAQARADGRSAADLANTMSIVSDVFTIATVAAAGATVFFVIIEGMNPEEESLALYEDEDGARLLAAPMASPDGGGVSLIGQF